MNTMEVVDYFRAFNALLGVACFFLLVVRLMAVWGKLANGQRLLFMSVTLWMVTVFWGSLELIIQDAPMSYRAMVNSVALMLLLAYLTEPSKYYKGRVGIYSLGGHNFRAQRETPDATL